MPPASTGLSFNFFFLGISVFVLLFFNFLKFSVWFRAVDSPQFCSQRPLFFQIMS